MDKFPKKIKEDNYLYKTTTHITLDETMELNKVNKSLFKRMFISDIIISILSIISSISNTENITAAISGLLITITICNIIIWLMYPSSVKRFYNQTKNKKTIDLEYDIYFYNDYLEKVGEHNSTRIKYNEILNIIETEKNFFIEIDKNAYIGVSRTNCDSDLINFIRQINEEKYKNLAKNGIDKEVTSKKTNKKISFLNNTKLINSILNIFFVLSLACIALSAVTESYLMKINNLIPILSNTIMWAFWLYLPVPVISLILGIIFKNKGYECQRNIIVGLIMSIVLFMYGTLSTFHEKITYEEIEQYNQIIGFNIPDNGKYYKSIWDTNYEGSTNTYAIIKDNNDEVNEYIVNSDKWLKGNSAKKLRDIFPSSSLDTLQVDKDCYYLVYDSDLEVYNEIPTDQNEHNLIYAKYYPENATLEIINYKYKNDIEEDMQS